MPTYKLLYFPARAAGEVIRQIFAYAGQEYEDVRIDYKDWDAIKESQRKRKNKNCFELFLCPDAACFYIQEHYAEWNPGQSWYGTVGTSSL